MGEIDRTENARRLEVHVYPIRFDGRRLGDVALGEFTRDMTDAVLRQPTLPRGSMRHVAQCLLRLMNLAVEPARVLKVSPIPPKLWLPKVNLRATFVTLSLALDRTEDWVMRRTGHSSSLMLARYRRDAETVREHNLGWLVDLHEHIPEFKNSNHEPAISSGKLTALLKNRSSSRRLLQRFQLGARGGT